MRVEHGRKVYFRRRKDTPQAIPRRKGQALTLEECLALKQLTRIQAKASKQRRAVDLVNLVMGINFPKCQEPFKVAMFDALVREMGGCDKAQTGSLNMLLASDWINMPDVQKSHWAQWLYQHLSGLGFDAPGSKKQKQMVH